MLLRVGLCPPYYDDDVVVVVVMLCVLMYVIIIAQAKSKLMNCMNIPDKLHVTGLSVHLKWIIVE